MSDRDRMADSPSPPVDRSVHEEHVRYIVAGLLSTIDFVPSSSHPENMLGISDLVIHAVTVMGTERGNYPMTDQGEQTGIPTGQDGKSLF